MKRGKQRLEPLGTGKVFGIGLSKTGTTSLYAALHVLGYRAGTYRHLHDLGLDDWFAGDFRHDYLERFDALTDLPIGCFFRELDERYPGSKFVLTVRAKEAWMASCRGFFTKPRESDAFFRKTQEATYGTVLFQEPLFASAFDAHAQAVRSHFEDRPSDLLALDLFSGEGWEKLCPFLGCAIPEAPFPNVKPGYRPTAAGTWARAFKKIGRRVLNAPAE